MYKLCQYLHIPYYLCIISHKNHIVEFRYLFIVFTLVYANKSLCFIPTIHDICLELNVDILPHMNF